MTGEDYLSRVRECNCVICLKAFGAKTSPCAAHHVGTGAERDDFATAALCHEHHQGATGVHGLHRTAFNRMWKVSDIILLALTARQLHK